MPLIRLPALLATALLLPLGHAADAPLPNILFIFCDDLGYGDVGVFHQNERATRNDRSVPYFTTRHLDGMAGEGHLRIPQDGI